MSEQWWIDQQRGLPIKIGCSYDSRTGTWTWTIAIGIEGGDIRVWNSIIVSDIFLIYAAHLPSFYFVFLLYIRKPTV